MSHANNPEILKRLRRAAGHLASVVAMVEDGRDCLAITQQMQAVIKALEMTKRTLIHHHIDEHLGHVAGNAAGPLPAEARALVAEIKEISKYL
ncbi:metal-sensing transcriptional repressor [Kaistia dalseonensis]|uniref:DNA-binding FrmR family transcriptional regulator n=1 Tax=Kaistia dalseonensis TaxID=410840 RepID=A0ABU0HCJ6_9HYPH|nr:metal-sensing transcriptional repressor [Kaistia dalseonensis]MCX5497387.1 metal-sensing transcriptional repressor [Kaistia dalseonensis]MDQ0440026.1 DNA-binding FrmR family transcriptional regulator [Kaistia dalseonensis]